MKKFRVFILAYSRFIRKRELARKLENFKDFLQGFSDKITSSEISGRNLRLLNKY